MTTINLAYKTARRRAIAERILSLELEHDLGHPAREDELERANAALRPVTLREAIEDLGAAWQGFTRAFLKALRA